MESQIDHSDQRSGTWEESQSRQSKTFEWEVLPPKDRQSRKLSGLEPLFQWLALIMDDFLRLPGTSLRFGLDPIIGLLPGVGDVASAIISAVALVHAARYGVPKILLARMATNILINELVGIVPGLGDAFSFWFKSNVRNYELLRRYSAAPARSRRGDWIFRDRSSQPAVYYCLCGIDRDRPGIAGDRPVRLRPINRPNWAHS